MSKIKDIYMKFNCPECGTLLEVWSEETVELRKEKGERWPYECRYLIRHCENCGSDWKNIWQTEFGNVEESQLRREFWG